MHVSHRSPAVADGQPPVAIMRGELHKGRGKPPFIQANVLVSIRRQIRGKLRHNLTSLRGPDRLREHMATHQLRATTAQAHSFQTHQIVRLWARFQCHLHPRARNGVGKNAPQESTSLLWDGAHFPRSGLRGILATSISGPRFLETITHRCVANPRQILQNVWIKI